MIKLSGNAVATAIVCSALVACGGIEDSDTNVGKLAPPAENLARANSVATIAEDALPGNVESSVLSSLQPGDYSESVSLAGDASSLSVIDMVISNAEVTAGMTSSNSIAYRFEVFDTGGADLPFDELSVALEVGASGSFADSYRIALFDIRRDSDSQTGSAVALTARSALTDLPSGNYSARLVVNPNWQNAFDTVPATHDDRQPFRYIEERDYSNNASNVFQIDVTNTKECIEDSFEDNDSFSTATVIPAGGQIDSVLCLDEVDFYSVDLTDRTSTSLAFDYTDNEDGLKRATSYVVFDANANRIADGIAREANDIVIIADAPGIHYLALYGQRSSYQIVRADGPGLADDFSDDGLFGDESIVGPHSWLFGEVTLHKLAFSKELLNDQVINCGRITTQFSNQQPIAYVTPGHFADIHKFHLLTNGSYLVDDQPQAEWTIADGDIVSIDWYENAFPGYAETVGSNSWRYWSGDGLAYAECTLEFNNQISI